MEKVIEIKNLTYRYQKKSRDVLKNVSFDIYKGEWVSIVGHNGSGKSTLMKILLGLIYPENINAKVCGIDLNEQNIYEIRKHIGYVCQNPDNQFVATSIEDDIAFGLENLCIPQEEMEERIDNALNKVSMMEHKYDSPSQLSGGEKQRCSVASILAINPDIYVFDEATSMLDPEGRKDVMDVLNLLKKDGKTIIMITHNMEEVLFSDRTIVLSRGEVLKDSDTASVLSDSETLEKAKLEMPSSLYLYKLLENKNYKNKEVMDKLWESAFKK